MAVDVTVLKVDNPWCFWLKEAPGPMMSNETSLFQELNERIQDHCSSQLHISKYLLQPRKGQICLAKRATDKRWYRAKIQTIMHSTQGPQASLYLLDFAENIRSPTSWLREMPNEFQQVPFQVKEARLYKTQPVTLETCYVDCSVNTVPCKVWDTSATVYFKNAVKDATSSKVEVVHHDTLLNIFYVKLYLNMPVEGLVDMNEDLVVKKYAIRNEVGLSPSKHAERSPLNVFQKVDVEKYLKMQFEEYEEAERIQKEETEVKLESGEHPGSQGNPLSLKQLTKLKSFNEQGLKQSLKSPPKALAQSWGVPDGQMSSSEDHWSGSETTANIKRQQTIGRGRFLANMLSKLNGNKPGSQEMKSEELEPVMISRRKLKLNESSLSSLEVSDTGNFGTVSTPWSKQFSSTKVYQETSSDSSIVFKPTQKSLVSVDTLSNAPSTKEDIKKNEMEDNKNPVPGKKPQSMVMMLRNAVSSSSVDSRESDSVDIPTTGKYKRKRQNILSLLENSSDGLVGSSSQKPLDHQHSPSQQLVGKNSEQDPDIQSSHGMDSILSNEKLESFAAQENQSLSSQGKHVHWRQELVKDEEKGTQMLTKSSNIVGILKTPSPQHTTSLFPEQRVGKFVSGTPTGTCSLNKEMDKKMIQERLQSQLLDDKLPSGKQELSEDITLVHGDRPLRPIIELDQAPFPDMFKRMLKKKNFCTPSLIESHSWPTILRGRDMVGVSRESRSLGYLLPLFTQVVQPSAYSALDKGNGPLIVVIVPRWKKAKQVYDDALSMLPNSKYIRALVIHGAGAEENKEIDLINGCEILVATPLCFLRLLKKSHVNTERLCHLVFDDADVVFSDFTQEVREIMQSYGNTLLAQPNRSAPRQILAFSAHWTPAVESFMKAYQSDPLVIITRKLEAAVYGKVWHVVHSCHSSHKYNKILDLLDTVHTQTRGRRVVVFTQYREDAINLHHMLLSSSHYALLVHDDMNADEVQLVNHEWRANHQPDSMPVLVMTDDTEFTLTNATWLIHFDFPASRGKFGDRLFFCRDNFINQLQQDPAKDANKPRCLSHMLLSMDDYEHLTGFAQFMKQTRQKLPSKFDLEQAKQAKEARKKTKKLCKKLKTFGRCSDDLCHFRHQLYAELDNPVMLNDNTSLPVSGYVKILVTYILDATHYFARVVSSQKELSGDEIIIDSATTVKLNSDLQRWFEDPSHRVKHSDAKCGDLCVIEDSRRVFHRARVEMFFARDTKNATVQLVDIGRFEAVATDQLLRLPAHLFQIPFQVVEVILCHLKPKDQDTDWTNQASAFVHNIIYQKVLCGRVVLSLGNTLWLDPLVERVQLTSIKTFVNEHNIRLELLKRGFADHNTEHIKLLKECCKGRIDICCPPSDKEEEKVTQTIATKMMHLSEQYVNEVYLSAIDTPDLIYVQKLDKYKRLEALMKEINDRMENSIKNHDSVVKHEPGDGASGDHVMNSSGAEGGSEDNTTVGGSHWKAGSYCLAKFALDAMWYRGQIVTELSTEEHIYTVFFLDYGDQEDVPEGDIHPIWDDALQLPFQAIECRLSGVKPTQAYWTEEDGNAVWDICNEAEGKRVLDAKVVSKGSSCLTNVECYEVQLTFNAVTPGSLSCISSNLAVNLVLRGLVLPSDTTLETMFPMSDDADPVSEVCRAYYKTKEKDEKLYLARNISDITSNLLDSGASLKPQTVRALCYVFSIATDPNERLQFIQTIVNASYRNFRNCDEISEHGCLKEVCALLSQTTGNKELEKVLWILKTVAITRRVRDNLESTDIVESLCSLLSSNTDPPVITNGCLALTKLMSQNPINQELLKQAGGVKILCELLKQQKENMSVCQTVLEVVSELATNSRYRDEIRELGGLESMCDFLWNVEDEEVLKVSAQTLKYLGNGNHTNMTAMINEGMLDSIESLLMSPSFSESTTKILSELDMQLLEFSFMNKAKIDLAKRAEIEGVNMNAFESCIVEEISQTEGDKQTVSSKQLVPAQSKVVSDMYHGYQAVVSPKCATNDHGIDDLDLSDLPPLEVAESVERRHPKVLWSQKSNSILLSVQLRGIQENEVVVTSKTVSFSTILDIICYEFSLELFGSVSTDNHVVVVTGSEVLITLFKQNKNVRWPRLTKSKSKLSFVGVDFERWEEDSSSSEEHKKEKVAKHNAKPKVKVNKRSSGKAEIVVLPEFDTSTDCSLNSSSDSQDQFNF